MGSRELVKNRSIIANCLYVGTMKKEMVREDPYSKTISIQLEQIKVKVVILAGGYGSRLSEYTKTIPKPMVKVLGVPIIQSK